MVFESKGATLHSIKDNDGVEYLWEGNPEYWSGQAPVLFPICGSIRDDKAQIGNRKQTNMPRHGVVRKKNSSVLSRQKTASYSRLKATKKCLLSIHMNSNWESTISWKVRRSQPDILLKIKTKKSCHFRSEDTQDSTAHSIKRKVTKTTN